MSSDDKIYSVFTVCKEKEEGPKGMLFMNL